MKELAIWWFSAAVTVSLQFVRTAGADQDPDQVPVGVSLPLTGPVAVYGDLIKNTLEFANSESGNKLKLIFQDDQCTPQGAVTVAQKFTSIDRVSYVLGFACSGSLLAAAPIYDRAKVPVIATLATAPKVSAAGDYIFRTCPSDAVAGKLLSDYVVSKTPKFAIVAEETEFVEGLIDGFGDPRKLTIERFPSGSTDFRSLLLRVRAHKPEGLVLLVQSESPLISLVKQIQAIEWSIPLYGAYFPGSPEFLKSVTLQQSFVFVDVPGINSLINKDHAPVYQRYLQKYGEPKGVPDAIVFAYNSLLALTGAINAGGGVKEALYNGTFTGLTDEITFDSNGDVRGVDHVLKHIKNGKIGAL